MEYIIIIAIVLAYSSLNSKIEKLSKKLDIPQKTYKDLKAFLNEKVNITMDDEYVINVKGILKSYDNNWFEIETTIKHKNKTTKETTFYKINNIKTITIDTID